MKVQAVRVPRAPHSRRPIERRLRWRRPRPVGGPSGASTPTAPPRSVAAWMTPAVACVDEEAPLAAIRALLLRTGRAVPVVAADGWLMGIVTSTDVLRTADDGDRDLTAGDVMSAFVFAVPPTASIERAAALMAYEGVAQLVVVDGDRRVAGLVTTGDVARALARGAGYVV